MNTYDGLYQVKTLDRGTLNGSKTGISGTPSWEEDWNYDPTGNWRGTSQGQWFDHAQPEPGAQQGQRNYQRNPR